MAGFISPQYRIDSKLTKPNKLPDDTTSYGYPTVNKPSPYQRAPITYQQLILLSAYTGGESVTTKINTVSVDSLLQHYTIAMGINGTSLDPFPVRLQVRRGNTTIFSVRLIAGSVPTSLSESGQANVVLMAGDIIEVVETRANFVNISHKIGVSLITQPYL